MHNPEDKAYWLEHGEECERKFCEVIAPAFGLDAIINPQKLNKAQRHYPDLFVNGVMSDLKSVSTPFYTASRYGFNANNTVTLNRKELNAYLMHWPWINIYFWVAWKAERKFETDVQENYGVWMASIDRIRFLIKTNRSPIHSYQRREINDGVHGRDSHLIDLRQINCIGIFNNEENEQR